MKKNKNYVEYTLTQKECENIYSELEMRIGLIKNVNILIDVQTQMHKIIRDKFAYKYYPFNVKTNREN